MRRIALNLGTDEHLREVAEGFVEKSLIHQDWLIYVVEHGQRTKGTWFEEWPWDCVVTNTLDWPGFETLRERGIPFLLVEHDPVDSFPVVRGNDAAIGRLALEHFHSLGLKRVAYWGQPGCYYSDLREEAFVDAAKRQRIETFSRTDTSFDYRRDMPGWLRSLPKPIGIFVHVIIEARRLAVYCREQELCVPEDIAILGVDNKDLLCRANRPALSAIDQGCRRIGALAAEFIDRHFNGEPFPEQPVLVPPAGVVQRRSTDFIAVEDEHVAQALLYIRDNACDCINAADVIQHVPISRRSLEQRFKQYLNRTIHQEIIRVRIERVKELLAETHLDLGTIAIESGFSWPSEMSKVFRKVTDVTPSQYRNEIRGR